MMMTSQIWFSFKFNFLKNLQFVSNGIIHAVKYVFPIFYIFASFSMQMFHRFLNF